MGRPRKWPPSILRHKSGRSFVRIARRDYYLPGAPGSPEAKAEYSRLIAELADAPRLALAPSKAPTVAKVCAAFLEHASKTYGASGEADNYRSALSVVTSLYGDLPAADFKLHQLRAVRALMCERWCRNVVNRQTVRVRTAWRWAEEAQLVPEGAWAHLSSLAPIHRSNRAVRQTADRQGVEWEIVRQTLRHLPPVGRAMVLLQWYTGMRPGEVRKLRLSELRPGPDGLLIYDTGEHKTAYLDGAHRVAVIGRMGQRVLRKWLAVATDYVFPIQRVRLRRYYDRRAYGQMVRRACLSAGLPLWSPYNLRHAMKDRITASAGLEAARAQLGHRSLGTTNGYGNALDIRLAAEAMRKTG